MDNKEMHDALIDRIAKRLKDGGEHFVVLVHVPTGVELHGSTADPVFLAGVLKLATVSTDGQVCSNIHAVPIEKAVEPISPIDKSRFN